MTDDDLWICLDGPEPDLLRPLLAAMREVPPPTPEDRARAVLALREKLDADRPRPPDPDPDPEPVAEDPPRDAAPPAGDDSATLRAPSLVEGADAPAPPALVEAPPPEVPAARPPARLAATSPVGLPAEVLQGLGELPFRPGLPAKRAPKTLQTPVERVGFGETLPVGDDSVARAVAAVPFVGSRVPAAVVQVPELTVSQYASLCAELGVRPERAGRPEKTILAEYRVANRAAREALDEHWGKVFAEQPEVRVEFERCLREFSAYLRRQVR